MVSPSPSRPNSRNTLSSTGGGRSGEALISALKLRDAKLQRTQDIVAKFLEVCMCTLWCILLYIVVYCSILRWIAFCVG